jgi:hypothetical protein
VKAKRILAAAVVALVAVSCARSSDRADDLRVVPLAGDVHILDGGDPIPVGEETSLDPGDVLGTGPGGRAVVEVGLSGRIEVGGNAQVVADRAPEVLRGSVLATAAPSGLAVRAGDAEVEASRAVFRVDSGLSVTVAVYRGAASILGFGDIQALRQAVVVAGGSVPRGTQPLEVRPYHPWDIRLLGAAIDLGLDLVRLERGLGRALPRRGQEHAVVQALAGRIPRSVALEILRRVNAAEAVVAAEVSKAAAEASPVSVAQVLAEVLDLKGQGAHWIVVAAQWRLPAGPLLAGLERLAGIVGRLVAPSASDEQAQGRPGARGAGGGGGSGGGGGGSAGASSAASGGTDGGTTGGDPVGTDPAESTSEGGGGGSGGSGSGGSGSGGSGSGIGGTAPGGTAPGGCGIDVGCVVDEVVEELEAPQLPGDGGGGGVLP